MNFLFQNKKQFFIFVVGGGLGALLNLGITYLLTEFAGFWYLYSYLAGAAANIIFNFIYHRSITFSVKDKIKKRILNHVVVSVFFGLSSVFLVYLFTDILGLWYMFSIVVIIVVTAIANFFINKFWVFASYE